mmetsp:Transcript_5477/g.15248  ORF Transcript_5477/g.15248 Transcript_5477/m.15248 type:complete len:764 (-) Transcript_5477:234-2525(-)
MVYGRADGGPSGSLRESAGAALDAHVRRPPGAQSARGVAAAKRRKLDQSKQERHVPSILDKRPPLTGVWGLKRAFEDASSWAARNTVSLEARSSVGALKVSPSFLSTNSTSHTWVLGALAEIMDNSLDSKASFINVDVGEAMLFRDNERFPEATIEVLDDGRGMTLAEMGRALGLGHSMNKDEESIGGYGNGLKAGGMRLGAVLMVISKSRATRECSAGLCSYLYNTIENHDNTLMPVVGWDLHMRPSPRDDREWREALAAIVKWGPFQTETELLSQLSSLPEKGGTKIIVTCLWADSTGKKYELDFDSYKHDIVLREEGSKLKLGEYARAKLFIAENGGGDDALEAAKRRHWDMGKLRSECQEISLRMYASILYLRYPVGFNGIWIRGEQVQKHSVLDDMLEPLPYEYKPQKKAGRKMDITIGFAKEAPHTAVRIFYVYHRNRLVMQWEAVTCNWSTGKGVIGMIDQDLMSWTHTKQGMQRDLMGNLKAALKKHVKDYWQEKAYLFGYKEERHCKKSKVPKDSEKVAGSNEEYNDNYLPLPPEPKAAPIGRLRGMRRVAARPTTTPPTSGLQSGSGNPADHQQNEPAAVSRPQICPGCDRVIDRSEDPHDLTECSTCIDAGRDPPNACHFFCLPEEDRLRLANEEGPWECKACKAEFIAVPSGQPQHSANSTGATSNQPLQTEELLSAAGQRAEAAEMDAADARAAAALDAVKRSLVCLRDGVKQYLDGDLTRKALATLYELCSEDGLHGAAGSSAPKPEPE